MAKVSIAHTDRQHRSIEEVEALVRKALDPLGSLSRFIKRGDTVLLKPNQSIFYTAEEGCTTDPLLVGALIRLARQAGAARVQVGESSLGFLSSLDCMRATGMAASAEREGAELIDLGSDETPNRIAPILDGRVIREAPLPAPVLDAHVVIDVPKAKTGRIEPISGALENWAGVVNQGWRQRNYGDADTVGRFVDIMSVSKPHLCVVDAVIAGEGDGPLGVTPRWCGCVLASTDPVATDVAIAGLLGRDWRAMRFAEAAERHGLGVRQPIEYAGTPLDKVAFLAAPAGEGPKVNLLIGRGVSAEGTVGHVRSALSSLHRRGQIAQAHGVPTIMIGETDDLHFEQHLRQGPYIVFDDAAKPEYRNHPRVYFVPGHPVLGAALPELVKGLGIPVDGKMMLSWRKAERRAIRSARPIANCRKMVTVAKPLAVAGATAALLIALARRLTHLK